jgi:hypothetical protein
MLGSVPITFDKPLPLPDAIHAKLCELTGLKVNFSLIHPFYGEFEHEEFRNPVEFAIKERTVWIYLLPGSLSYLEWSLIATLVEMGGDYRGDSIPKWARLKWKDRKWWQFIPR